MKVMFEIPDDSLISTGLSDILSIQNKKLKQTKKPKKNKLKKENKETSLCLFSGFGNQGTYLTANCKHPHLKIQVITR